MTRDEFKAAVAAAIEDERHLAANAEQMADLLQTAQSLGGPRSAERRKFVSTLWTFAFDGVCDPKDPAAVSIRRRVERIVRIREGAPATPQGSQKKAKGGQSDGEDKGEPQTVEDRIASILHHLSVIETVEASVSGLTATEVGGLTEITKVIGRIRQAHKSRMAAQQPAA